MANMTYKNGKPSWELDEEETKVAQNVLANKYTSASNQKLVDLTKKQANDLIKSLNSKEYKDSKARVERQKSIYELSNNISRLKARGYDVSGYENSLKEIQETSNVQASVFSGFNDADSYNIALKNSEYADKYKNVTTYNDVDKIIKGDSYNTLDDDEKFWLKKYKLQLADEEQLKTEKAEIDLTLNKLRRINSVNNAARAFRSNKDYSYEKSIESNKDFGKEIEELKILSGQASVLETKSAQEKKEKAFDEKWGKYTEAAIYYDENDEVVKFQKYINQKTYERNLEMGLEVEPPKINSYIKTGDDIYLDYLTREEGLTLRWLNKFKGAAYAQQYYDELIDAKLDARRAEEKRQKAFDYASSGTGEAILASVNSVGDTVASGVEYVANLVSGKADRRSVYAARVSGTREGVKELWSDSKSSEVWDFLYDTGMSGVDSLAAVGFDFIAPGVGEAVLGAAAAAQTSNQLLDSGVSTGNVVFGSLMAGVFEALFEHISIGQLDFMKTTSVSGILSVTGFTKESVKQITKNLAKNIMTNASEEFFTEIANVVSDQVIQGSLSQYAQMVAYNVSNGMSIKDAKINATKETIKQTLLAAAGGALIGFGFGTVDIAASTGKNLLSANKSGKILKCNINSINELKNIAFEFGTESDIYKTISFLDSDSSSMNLGIAYNKLVIESVKNVTTELTEAINEKSIIKEPEKVALKILDFATKNELTSKEKAEKINMFENKNIEKIYNEFVVGGRYGGDALFRLLNLVDDSAIEIVENYDFESKFEAENTIKRVIDDLKKPEYSNYDRTSYYDIYNEESINFNDLNDNINSEKTLKRSALYSKNIEGYRDLITYKLKEGSNSLFSEPDVGMDFENLDYELLNSEGGLTAEQVMVVNIGKALGVEVSFNYIEGVDGMAEGNKIYINPNATEPIKFIFKHELMHYYENSGYYNDFKSYVFEKSTAFKEWLSKNGFQNTGEAINEIKKSYGTLNSEGLENEVIANFVGDTLFGENNDNVAEDFLKEVATDSRNLFQRLVDWIKSLVNRLRGSAIERDIAKLEQKVKKLGQTVEGSNISEDGKYLYAGKKAVDKNSGRLENAKRMFEEGIDNETIRKKTGWFKGMDGRWRFEINDSEMKFTESGKAFINAYMERNFANKNAGNDITKEVVETTLKYLELKRNYKLGELIEHNKLFDAYPEFRNIEVKFVTKSAGDSLAMYSPEIKCIIFNDAIIINDEHELKEALIHELQHAIQDKEVFALGSGLGYWLNENASGNMPKDSSGKNINIEDAYMLTAGEIEAYDVSNRMDYDETLRKRKNPDIYNKNVLFAESPIIEKFSPKDVFLFNCSGEYKVYEKEEHFAEFIQKSLNDHKYKIKLCLGNIDIRFTKLIYNCFGLELERNNVVISPEDMVNIINSEKESNYGYVENNKKKITQKDLKNIPDIMCKADSMERVNIEEFGQLVMKFEKVIGDEKYILLLAYDKNSPDDLFVRRIYKEKAKTKENNGAPLLFSFYEKDNNYGTEEYRKKNFDNDYDTDFSKENKKYLYAGRKSSLGELTKFEKAVEMFNNGTDNETIRKETGWFKGMDSRWRFEINDSEMEFAEKNKDFINDYINFGKALLRSMINKKLKINLNDAKHLNYSQKIFKLEDLIKHDKLYEAYPQMKNLVVEFVNSQNLNGAIAQYSRGTVSVNELAPIANEKEFKKALVHELQHAIQDVEVFSLGSSLNYWIVEDEFGRTPKRENGKAMTPEEAYMLTAGEIEAYDVSKRMDYNEELRAETKPDIYKKDVLFIENPNILKIVGNDKILFNNSGLYKVYENDAQIDEFIKKALSDPQYTAKFCFGALDGTLSKWIEAKCGMFFELNNIVLSPEDANKILGSLEETFESDNKNPENHITSEDIKKVFKIIERADLLEKLQAEKSGNILMKFEKIIKDTKYTLLLEYDQNFPEDLFIRNIYKEKTSEKGTGNIPLLFSDMNNNDSFINIGLNNVSQLNNNNGFEFKTYEEYKIKEESNSLFSEPDVGMDFENLDYELLNSEGGLTAEQVMVVNIGKALGVEVSFNYIEGVDGMAEGNKIYINPNATEPIKFIFKHELMHYYENSGYYNDFKSYVFEKSTAFKEWLSKNGFQNTGEAINEIKRSYGTLNSEGLENEVIANFVGDTLFGKNNDNVTEDFLKELATDSRNLFQRLVDWIKSLVNRLRGSAIERDIAKLEQKVKKLGQTVESSNISEDGKYLYAGKKAIDKNSGRLENAKRMFEESIDNETIRKKTGWFKGMDGRWRFEINDSEMSFTKKNQYLIDAYKACNVVGKKLFLRQPCTEEEFYDFKICMAILREKQGKFYNLSDFIKHDKLFKAYPELKNLPVRFDFEGVSGVVATYSLLENNITINISSLVSDEIEIKKTLLHELQHAIQSIEYFATGSGNDTWILERELGNIPRYANGKEMDNYNAYLLTAGETESNDVENRLFLNNKERKENAPNIYDENILFRETAAISQGERSLGYYKRNQGYETYDSAAKLNNFIKRSFEENDYNVIFRFGTLDPRMRYLMREYAGVGTKGRNVFLASDDVKRILNSFEFTYDDPIYQHKKGKKIKQKDFAKIPQIICKADSIEKVGTDSEKNTVIKFEKILNDEKYTLLMAYKSNNNMFIKTIFKEKTEEKGRGNLPLYFEKETPDLNFYEIFKKYGDMKKYKSNENMKDEAKYKEIYSSLINGIKNS